MISIMKMNGMQMWKYWATNFIFDMSFYALMVTIYFIYGIFVLKITYFTETSFVLQILVYTGWGIA